MHMDRGRNREESITVETLSLEQLGNLLAKFGESVNGGDTFDRSLVLSSKVYHDQPEKNVHKLAAENERLGKMISQGRKEETPVPQCHVEIPRENAHVCFLLRKKTIEKALLLLLLSLISIGMILPFCLTVGTTIYERSSTAGFDFTYDETCDPVSK